MGKETGIYRAELPFSLKFLYCLMTCLCYLFSKVNKSISAIRLACCQYRRCSRLCTFPCLGLFPFCHQWTPTLYRTATSSLTLVSRRDEFLWRERTGECHWVFVKRHLSCKAYRVLCSHMQMAARKETSLLLWAMNTSTSFSRNKHSMCLKQTHIRKRRPERPKTFKTGRSFLCNCSVLGI